jgi:hypothetical protein
LKMRVDLRRKVASSEGTRDEERWESLLLDRVRRRALILEVTTQRGADMDEERLAWKQV